MPDIVDDIDHALDTTSARAYPSNPHGPIKITSRAAACIALHHQPHTAGGAGDGGERDSPQSRSCLASPVSAERNPCTLHHRDVR